MKNKKIIKWISSVLIGTGTLLAIPLITTSCSTVWSKEWFNDWSSPTNSVVKATCSFETKDDNDNFRPNTTYTINFQVIKSGFTNKKVHIGYYDESSTSYKLSTTITCSNTDVQNNPSDYFLFNIQGNDKMEIVCKKPTIEDVYLNWNGQYATINQSYYDVDVTFPFNFIFFKIV
jgi:hypothetical protein